MLVRVRTPSRLHITLIDLNGSLGRIDGGVGLALNEPHIEIKGELSDEIVVEGGRVEIRERCRDIALKLREEFKMGRQL